MIHFGGGSPFVGCQSEELSALLSERSCIVMDLETNGLETETAILEIGALCIPPNAHDDPLQWGSFESLISFNGIPNPGAFAVNNISLADLQESGRELTGVLREFIEFSRGAVLIGHNIIDFDLRILGYHTRKAGIELAHHAVIDTKRLAQSLHPHLESHRLANLVRHFGIKEAPTHRAYADVVATYSLFKHLIQGISVLK